MRSATESAARWVPATADRWQWQLRGTINTGYAVQVYDIDLFDAPQDTIALLKAQGKRVVCYFSAGSSESWRADFHLLQPSDMGNDLADWPGERWLDTRSANVRQIMLARLDLARSKGCDGVEPDNVDGYANNPGLPLTAASQLEYNRFLASAAHARGLAVGLKNDLDQVAALADDFDFAVNEQCHQHGECGAYAAFTSRGKPVFNAEYAADYQQNTGGARDALCAAATAANIRTLVLPLTLDDTLRHGCDTLSPQAQADCLFDWGQRSYPALLAGASGSISADPWYFRFYAATGWYVGVNSGNDHLYYLAPASAPVDLGATASWFATAGCQT